jgi:hypothetical protein
MKLLANGKVNERGELHIKNRLQFDRELKSFAGKEVNITIEKKSRKRSTQQLRYYWGVCVPIIRNRLRELGYDDVRTSEDAHEILKALFNKGTFIDKSTGESINYGKTTTGMSTSDFMDYIAEIQKWAAESLDVFVPDAIEELRRR